MSEEFAVEAQAFCAFVERLMALPISERLVATRDRLLARGNHAIDALRALHWAINRARQ